jgi:SAM-dependent methyltransferase
MKGNILRAVEPVPQGYPEPEQPLRIDIGCGRTKMDGWDGIDAIDFGQKHVHDVRSGLPFADASVAEARSSHFVEHLTGEQRIAFFNELHRVLKPGAQALIVTPNWSHACAYGDPTHQWPPMSEWYALYLNKAWREANAPHVGYTCDFDWSTGGSWDESIACRNEETRGAMMRQNTNAWRDLIITLTKRA